MPAPLIPPPITAILTVKSYLASHAKPALATYLKWMSFMSVSEWATVADEVDSDSNDLAVMLTGGGARASYQVGLIRGLAHHFPHLRFQIVTGVSAGAINATILAAKEGTLQE